ncbi:hypothetical protein [Segatella copri]|nr:hypothetical protein [Segatella copri]
MAAAPMSDGCRSYERCFTFLSEQLIILISDTHYSFQRGLSFL